jgi:hypothetical protein
MAATIAAIPAENVREVRRMYRDIGAMTGLEAWVEESRASRRWMENRFDQSRLATEREAIIARGRSQSAGGDSGPA